MVFSILTSLPTASITPLKQPYCISMIISSIPSDHRSCHVFASLICLPILTPLTITALELQNRVSACVAEVSLWMCSNRFQLNPAKTEILWFSSSRRQFQIPQVPFCVGTVTIAPSSVVCDLGIYLDSNLSMTTHISVLNCFSTMRLG